VGSKILEETKGGGGDQVLLYCVAVCVCVYVLRICMCVCYMGLLI
jgi:hypothetical protein